MTTKKHLHIFIIFFLLFSFVLPKTENILPAKNVAPFEITLDDNINKQEKQDKQNLTRKDDRKTDPWAIVSAIIAIISLIFLPINLSVWFALSLLSFLIAIFSFRRIKRHNNLKGKFWDYLALIISGIISVLLIIGIIAIIMGVGV